MWLLLTFSRSMLLVHGNQLIDLSFKSINWFLFDENIRLTGLNAAEKSLIKIREIAMF